MATELVALVKHDCPVCDRLLPALDAAGVRVVSQWSRDETAAQADRLGLAHVPELDDDLALSARLDLDAVPALVLFEDGEREADRVEGLQRARIAELAQRAGTALDLDGLPEWLPGCASRTRDPEVRAAAKPEFALHGLVATTHPAGPAIVAFGTDVAINAAGNCLGQGTRANLVIGRGLQLTVRNVGGGRPQVEDRAAHGQPGKVGLCFAEREEGNPWPPPFERPTVMLMALEAPRIVVDQLAREPEGLAASLALALESVAHPKQRLAWDALLVVGPEHARVFGEAGWSREHLQQRLFELTMSPAGELVRGAGGTPEGIEARFVSDPEMPVAKFAAPDRIKIVHAGGDAGLFSMVFGSWAAGEIGSAPVTEEVKEWA